MVTTIDTPELDVHEFLTVSEVASLLRLTPRRIHQLVTSGRLPAFRLSDLGRRLVRRADALAILQPAYPPTLES